MANRIRNRKAALVYYINPWLEVAILAIISISAVVFGGQVFAENWSNKALLSYEISVFSFFILSTVLSKLVFGRFPLDLVRSRIVQRREKANQIEPDLTAKATEPTGDYMVECISESDLIAERVFDRAGVYLFVGCVIAFLGIILVSYVTVSDNYGVRGESEVAHDFYIKKQLMSYFPRISVTVVIELIAFFFLKQYRVMIQEYKYYEGVKRRRQDFYNFTLLLDKYSGNKEALTAITNIIFVDKSEKLGQGETTESLEIQKQVDKEYDFFAKATEFVKAIKG